MFFASGTGDGNIENNLYEFILQSQSIHYGVFDVVWRLEKKSRYLLDLHTSPPEEFTLMGIFPELCGYEHILHAIQEKRQPALTLTHIHNVDAMETGVYINLDIHPYNTGLLVIARDATGVVSEGQRITQQRNELDLQAGKLVVDLQAVNFDLKQAYETTMQGWSKALEMRDGATSGHSQRVTELTIRLAREVGIQDNQTLMHYWRGSLLHDIGKMGIPDSILFKPGPLNKDEWDIMKKHPLYAVELLKPIAYLKQSLDIPYYHHEKWDGSGYPFGLSGEDIPLSARIFAVVDAWDALTSNRPYQRAVPPELAIEILQQDSGSHFDPHIVEAFLRLYRQKLI